jgi:hypothetical protein
MSKTKVRDRFVAEARQRRRRYRTADKRRKKGMAETSPGQDDPLFATFREVTDTRHIFTYLASPFVADRNKPVSLYIARRVAEAVKVNYSDLFFSSLTNVYHYMLYQDFHDYMTNVCGIPLDETNLKDCFHDVYFPRFQNTEVYTRLWPKLGQHLEDSDGDLAD